MKRYMYPQRGEWCEITRRPRIETKSLEATVKAILDDVKERGDEAVIDYEARFDHASITTLAVSTREIDEAYEAVPKELIDAMVLAYGNTKHRFLSPVVQNATHVRLVRHILQEKFPVYGLVVFAQGNIEHIQSACVCAPYSVPERICTLSAGKAALTAAELDKIHSRILLHKNSYGVTKQEHMAHIRKLQQDLSSGICPRCGKPLALRHGKYGSFYGCSAYPKCKFTKPVR